MLHLWEYSYMSNYILSLIFLYSSQYNLDPKLVIAVIDVESGFRNVISKTGDYGLMQLNKKVYYNYSVEQLLDPETNIKLGIKHLAFAKQASKHKGEFSWLVFYNAGYKSNDFKYPELHPYVKKIRKKMKEFEYVKYSYTEMRLQ